MAPFRAAILTGPRGPFAVVELTADQQRRLTADARQRLVRCFREKHHNVPVVFVTASASTLHAIHGLEVTDDVQQCLSAQLPDGLPWMAFDPQPSIGGAT